MTNLKEMDRRYSAMGTNTMANFEMGTKMERVGSYGKTVWFMRVILRWDIYGGKENFKKERGCTKDNLSVVRKSANQL